MSKFKVGDRVRVERMSEYSMNVIKWNGYRSPIGDTGTVVQIVFNRNMERYGKGTMVYVEMDYNKNSVPKSIAIWNEDNLEKID